MLNDTDKLENIQRCAVRIINQNYKDRTAGRVTNMLRDLGLQSLHNRWKQQRLTFFCKIVRGLTHAIPANEFLTPVNSKRLIKPRNPTDFKTTNRVIDHARNNSHSYRVDPLKTAVYRYSFFPRTTIDWNNLEQEIVRSKTSESFKTQISRCPWNIGCSPLVRWRYWAIQTGLLTPLTFARHRLSPLAAFTSSAYLFHNGRRWQWICEFYTAKSKAFLEAHSHNVSGNKQ